MDGDGVIPGAAACRAAACKAHGFPAVQRGAVADRSLVSGPRPRNAPAIKRLVASGARLRPFSIDILDACYKATNELFTDIAAKNAMFKRLNDSMTAFRNEQYSWHQVCETTYDSYQIRQLSRT